MQVHSLIYGSLQSITSLTVKELAKSQPDESLRDVLLRVSEKIEDIEDMISMGQISTEPGINRMKPAVFIARQLDGNFHVGWHHAPVETATGDRFHYDHGVGINRNHDGQYLWFPPVTVFVNFTLNQETNLFEGEWEACQVETNFPSEKSFSVRAITTALEKRIDMRPATGYLAFSNPSGRKGVMAMTGFSLAY